jgi:hypothetical protein
MINLGDIGLINPSLFRVPLFGTNFAILGWVFSLVVDKAFAIKLSNNSLLLPNKLFLLVFIMEIYHLFYNIFFKSHTRRISSSFE